MKIAVIGTGNIGRTVGGKWDYAGHDITFGLRPGSNRDISWLEQMDARTATIDDAVQHAEVILLAIPGSAVEEWVKHHGQHLNGKIVIDATNRMGDSGERHSINAILAAAPDSAVYRAFNSLGWEVFDNPVINGIQADMFYCGPEEKRKTIEELIADIGVNPIFLGDLDHLALMDALTGVWFALVFEQKYDRHLAFKVLRD